MTTEETELTFVRCPSCRSLVPAVASRCRMCGHHFEGEAGESSADAESSSRKSRVRQRTISASKEEVEDITQSGARKVDSKEDPVENTKAAPLNLGSREPMPRGSERMFSSPDDALDTTARAPITSDSQSDAESTLSRQFNFGERGPGPKKEEAIKEEGRMDEESRGGLDFGFRQPQESRRDTQPLSWKVGAEAEEDEMEEADAMEDWGGEEDAREEDEGEGMPSAGVEPGVPREGGRKRRRRRRKRKGGGGGQQPGQEASFGETQQGSSASSGAHGRSAQERPAQDRPLHDRTGSERPGPHSASHGASHGSSHGAPHGASHGGIAQSAPQSIAQNVGQSGSPLGQSGPVPSFSPRSAVPESVQIQSNPQRNVQQVESVRTSSMDTPDMNAQDGAPRNEQSSAQYSQGGGRQQRGPVSGPQQDEGVLFGWIVNFDHDPRGTAGEIRAGKFFVGRQRLRPHDMVIGDSALSTPHCLISANRGEGFRVQDLMSEQGTFLKRRGSDSFVRVHDAVTVEHGDSLKFGAYEVTVCLIPVPGRK